MPFIGSKVCHGCKIEKPLSEFHRDHTRSDGRRHRCRICRNQVGWSKRPLDEIVFDCLTAPAAWLCGLIHSDGYVGNGEIEITIRKLDVEVFIPIQQVLGSNYEIDCRERETSYGRTVVTRLRVGSVKLARRLRALGVKSSSTHYISDELFSHFVRGQFDGDGCVTNQSKSGDLKLLFLGNPDFLRELRDRISRLAGIKAVRVYEATRTWRMDWCARSDVRRLATWMYQGAGPYLLRRKYDRLKGGDVLSRS